jgi:GAF domain-containing protein/anti-sigma regulatory factor (Ser/Thr protein kinase)
MAHGPQLDVHTPEPGHGQIVLRPSSSPVTPADQVRNLNRLSDPALSELSLETLLEELLERVRDALSVDTVAILLYEASTDELVARAASGLEEEVEQGVRIPLGQGFAGRIAAERVAIFVADVDEADILNPILRAKGIRSLLGVPLIVEGALIGVLHVGSITARTFGQKDVAVLQLAAARAAPAIERAGLVAELEREHEVAVLLQRSLLPRQLPDIAGISVAARYLAARHEVGGDWYDVIELPRGLLGIAIGDVVGHGIAAAALMGQMRTALRAYAQEGHGAGRTLELVDRYVQSTDTGAMATAAYAIFDPDTGSLRFATAGHVPPVVVGRHGTRLIEVPPCAPLGAYPYGNCHEHEATLAPHEMLVLYTDGLVERRGESIDSGIERLVALLGSTDGSLDRLADSIVEELESSDHTDDVALLAVQLDPVTMPKLSLRFPAEPRALAPMRSSLRSWLEGQGARDHEIFDILVAVNEACSNAIEHPVGRERPDVLLEAELADSAVAIAIRDYGRWRAPGPRGDRGRGLEFMDALMEDVEVRRSADGTTVHLTRKLEGSAL